jgi:hypothetical protein
MDRKAKGLPLSGKQMSWVHKLATDAPPTAYSKEILDAIEIIRRWDRRAREHRGKIEKAADLASERTKEGLPKKGG